MLFNTRIYNLSSGPHITRFSVVVAKKWKNFDYIFVLKRANTACRQQMTTGKLFHKHFNQLYYYVFPNWYYILTELLSVTTPSITTPTNREEFSADTVCLLQACFADLLSAMIACY